MGLPCPQCGSTRSLGSLRRKLQQVKDRIEAEKRRRYPPPPPPSMASGNTVMSASIVGLMQLAPTTSLGTGEIRIGDLYDKNTGTIFINDAALDVCVDCGTFYSSNVKEIGDTLQKEIYELDVLGALAEIRGPDE